MLTDARPLPPASAPFPAPSLEGRKPSPWGFRFGLAALALATALLTVWAIDSASESDYYAAIAVSMSQSPANFFFGAFDPAGTVTLDKIPGAFWIPALFVAVFGYATWTVVLPNALAAVVTVVIVAVTGRRLVSPTAGLVAGAVAATTPILIAVSRSNQPETFFVLSLALVAWAATRALTQRSLGWLITSGLFIALAFQMYMLVAWAVWPALALAYLVTAQPVVRRLWHIAVAGTMSVAASLSWIVIVSLIPADARPYIGSTLSNNPWEMVFGYNGLGRFSATANSSDYLSFSPPFSGDPSAVRLFTEQLAGQIAWLLPAAVLAAVVLWMLRFSRPVTVLLGAWLVVFAAMFSAVDGMHQFYTAALAIPVALLVGLAFGVARRHGILWPQVSLIAVAAVTAVLISLWYPGYSPVISLIQAAVGAAAILLLFAERTRPGAGQRWIPRWTTALLATIALVLTPAVWSAVTVANPSNINPVAGGVSDTGGGPGVRAADSGARQGRPAGSAGRPVRTPQDRDRATPRTGGRTRRGPGRCGARSTRQHRTGRGSCRRRRCGIQRVRCLAPREPGRRRLPDRHVRRAKRGRHHPRDRWWIGAAHRRFQRQRPGTDPGGLRSARGRRQPALRPGHRNGRSRGEHSVGRHIDDLGADPRVGRRHLPDGDGCPGRRRIRLRTLSAASDGCRD
ncbi:glycosyltransferase family 39 protein [Microbacterium schleiferi]|uniref:Glycosyltransferase family 39 protein n=1 Tax=Microbacterium schleiferi TaxID=69362 RepID=A0A7S8MW54_9MICO|nr:glycosyltransferase family 39 protein [Microbacterium schleiferi]QPE03580.1 glycosyltransferase family 39 protein [Microbacterium schleiferi]